MYRLACLSLEIGSCSDGEESRCLLNKLSTGIGQYPCDNIKGRRPGGGGGGGGDDECPHRLGMSEMWADSQEVNAPGMGWHRITWLIIGVSYLRPVTNAWMCRFHIIYSGILHEYLHSLSLEQACPMEEGKSIVIKQNQWMIGWNEPEYCDVIPSLYRAREVFIESTS